MENNYNDYMIGCDPQDAYEEFEEDNDYCLVCGEHHDQSCAYPDNEGNMSDVEADADTLKSAGMGTDEDYGMYESDDGEGA